MAPMDFEDDPLLREREPLFARRKSILIVSVVDMLFSVILFAFVLLFLTEKWAGLILFQLPHIAYTWLIGITVGESRYASHVLKLLVGIYAIALVLDFLSILTRIGFIFFDTESDQIILGVATGWIGLLVAVDIVQMVLAKHLIAEIRTHEATVLTTLDLMRRRLEIFETMAVQQRKRATEHPFPQGNVLPAHQGDLHKRVAGLVGV